MHFRHFVHTLLLLLQVLRLLQLLQQLAGIPSTLARKSGADHLVEAQMKKHSLREACCAIVCDFA